ncbi:MAG: ECF-type sigma factor [Acidobacteriota bacterium]
MRSNTESRLTELLDQWATGNTVAQEELLERIYPKLRAIAANRLRRSPAATSLQTTDLLHETFLKLTRQEQVRWNSRRHFFAITARLMRQVLIDHLRASQASKRGSGVSPIPLDQAPDLAAAETYDWASFDQVLTELGTINSHAEQIVELRFFAGMTLEETAEALNISRATVIRRWRFARAWLRHRIGSQ